jgi:hypothetical protein
MVRLKTFRSEQELVQWMNTNGVGLGNITQCVNSSGQPYVLYEEAAVDQVIIPGRKSPGGVSYADGTGGAGTYPVMAKRTAIAAELVSAITVQLVTGTLANTYVIPGSVSLTDSGGTGNPMKDDGAGKIVEVGTIAPRGSIDYATGVVSLTYPANKLGSGNLLADYEYSDLPDTADPPPLCRIVNVAVIGAGGDITFTVYNDEACTVPAFSGKVTVTAGEGTLVLGGNYAVSPIMEAVDLTHRDRRWVTVSAACEFFMYWEFCS